MRRRSAWRARAGLFGFLGLLILMNLAVLISYRSVLASRVKALEDERARLAKTRDETREEVRRLRQTEERLATVRAGLSRFYDVTLGTRDKRLASLIDDIHEITRKVGFVPETISYSEAQIPGQERLILHFQVTGAYADIKRLLGAFEASPHFFLLETLTLSPDQVAPDSMTVSMSVTRTFQAATSHVPGARRLPRRVEPASQALDEASPEGAEKTEKGGGFPKTEKVEKVERTERTGKAEPEVSAAGKPKASTAGSGSKASKGTKAAARTKEGAAPPEPARTPWVGLTVIMRPPPTRPPAGDGATHRNLRIHEAAPPPTKEAR